MSEEPRFGTWLRAKREEAKLSLRALAGHLGVSAPYLLDVERGNRSAIVRERWPQLAKALAVTEAEIEQAAAFERCPTCGGPRFRASDS